MNNLTHMKQLYNRFYHELKTDTVNLEEAHGLFTQLEDLFYASVEQKGIKFDRKDSMMQSLEDQSKQRLYLLEEKIHQGSRLSSIQEQTSHIRALIQAFWHEAGFHYVKTFRVNDYGTTELELGFSLDYGTTTSDRPITAKEQSQKTKERLQQEGYILNEKNTRVIDCDINKDKIQSLLLQRFPSASIFSWESFIENRKTNQHSIRFVKVRIPNIEEIIQIKTPQ